MADAKLKAEIRQEIGKNHVKHLRDNNFIPAVIYGRSEETKNIKVDERDFHKMIKAHGSSALIDLEIEGEKVPAIIKEMQNDPVKGNLIHIDFQKLRMDEKVKMTLPITIVGREKVDTPSTILVQQLDEIEIECLPKDIPQAVVADVSNIDLNTPFFVEDLEIYKNKDITIFRDPKDAIAILTEPTRQEESEEDTEETPEVEVIGEKEDTEE